MCQLATNSHFLFDLFLIVLFLLAAGAVLDHVQSKRQAADSESYLCRLPPLVLVLYFFVGLVWNAFDSPRQVPRIAEVRNDMSQLSAGIAAFKAEFSIDPPSSINLYEQQTGWFSDRRTVSLIRRIWPRFDFTIERDLNRDGDASDTIHLTGAECLVFFLGGVVDGRQSSTGDPRILGPYVGFSKDPADPFKTGGPRDGPFHDGFASRRFVDFDSDGFAELLPYRSQFEVPYIYLSSYGGAGYRKQEAWVYPPWDKRNLRLHYTADAAGKSPFKRDSFQLICAGFDNLYGPGGYLDLNQVDNALTGDREAERDNITNFYGGRLIDQ